MAVIRSNFNPQNEMIHYEQAKELGFVREEVKAFMENQVKV